MTCFQRVDSKLISENCSKNCFGKFPTIHVGGCPMTASESCPTIHLRGLSMKLIIGVCPLHMRRRVVHEVNK